MKGRETKGMLSGESNARQNHPGKEGKKAGETEGKVYLPQPKQDNSTNCLEQGRGQTKSFRNQRQMLQTKVWCLYFGCAASFETGLCRNTVSDQLMLWKRTAKPVSNSSTQQKEPVPSSWDRLTPAVSLPVLWLNYSLQFLPHSFSNKIKKMNSFRIRLFFFFVVIKILQNLMKSFNWRLWELLAQGNCWCFLNTCIS